MSDLPRLIDDDEADPELAQLFRAGRHPAPIPGAAFERSRKVVLGLVAAPAALGVLTWVQYAALGAALGTMVAAAAALPRFLAAPAVSPNPPGSSVASAPSVAPPLERAPDPVPSVAPAPTASLGIEWHPAPSTTPAEHELLRETKLLENARAELERRPELCLELLREHGREFPNGTLALEREFLTVASLIRLGRRSEAEARAAGLRARTPGNLYEKRLQRLLGSEGTPR